MEKTNEKKEQLKIICLQENLLKGLQAVSHLAGKNINLPILNNILIEAQGGEIKLTTTNLEIGINCQIRGKVEKEGKCTVQAKLLTDFISLLPKDNVIIELIDDKLNIKCAQDDTNIKTLSPEDFPLLPSVEEKNKYKVKTRDFKNALSKTAFAIALDSTRPEISGALFSLKNNQLTIVGTDSYRLSEKKINLIENSNDLNIIIPLDTVQEIIRVVGDSTEEYLEFFIDENQILFKLDGIELISRLTEGSYPDYQQIIPSSTKTKSLINIRKLIQAVKRTSLFCKPGINDIKLSFIPSKKELVIMSTSDQLGENITRVEAEVEGEENEITFNYRYLLDGLNNLNEENVQIEINDNSSPGLIKLKKDDKSIYIIMPIKQ